MALGLDEADEVLRGLTAKRSHVVRFPDHLMAWFFEPHDHPGIFYRIVLRYDGARLTVEDVRCVQMEPLTMTDMTKNWQQVPIIEARVKIVRNALKLL